MNPSFSHGFKNEQLVPLAQVYQSSCEVTHTNAIVIKVGLIS